QILTHYYVGTRVSLSNVSSKAVARGKKTPQELEEEAKTATQSTMDSEQTSAPEKDPEGEKDEQGRAKYAGKVVKSA
ncbi:MAG: hypothetical protein II168_06945, partial [Ruminococcus sp.]|nr:hypothetical protein [Ruminococcus sp.]